MQIDPIIGVFLQSATGKFYWYDWDATAGLTILPGAGIGTAIHNGTIYALTAEDTSFRPVLTNPTPVPDQWTSLTLTPLDDIAAALAKRAPVAALVLAPGDYLGQRMAMPTDDGFSVDVGAATNVDFYR